MLRNLNRSISGKRICGTPHSGVIGSLIPSTGDYGPGYAYNSLSLPADANKEYRGFITSVPSGLTLYAYEDTSFIASAADGTYVVPFDLYENGVFKGSTTFTLTFGESGTTISCAVGNAVAAGLTANIATGTTVSCLTGNATANGATANIYQGVTIQFYVGNAVAAGRKAKITNGAPVSSGRAVHRRYAFKGRPRQ